MSETILVVASCDEQPLYYLYRLTNRRLELLWHMLELSAFGVGRTAAVVHEVKIATAENLRLHKIPKQHGSFVVAVVDEHTWAAIEDKKTEVIKLIYPGRPVVRFEVSDETAEESIELTPMDIERIAFLKSW